MKQNFKRNIYTFFIVLIISLFLFPRNFVLAETYTVGGETYTYTTEDDGTDGPDVEGLTFELTKYGGLPLGSGYDVSKMNKNSEFGWMEYTEDGVNYVVFAAATHEMLEASHGKNDENWFYGAKFEHIHYFRYPQKFTFKFDDASVSTEVFNGIVLDSGDFMMFPQHEKFNRKKGINGLDTYFGPSGQSDPDLKGISGKTVKLSMDGTFSSSVAQQANTNAVREWWSNVISQACISLADLMQRAMDKTVTGNECRDLTYSQSELKAGKQKIKVIVEDENGNEKEEEQEEEIDKDLIKAINLRRSTSRRRVFRRRNRKYRKKNKYT